MTIIKKIDWKRCILRCAILACLFVSAAPTQVATGGPYTLDQAAVANGGGTSTGTGYAVTGTAGQGPAGANPMGGNYSVRNGFWNPGLAPTAASVVVSGRVIGQNGQGLPNVGVLLVGGPLTAPRKAVTNSLGYFTFEDIETGQNYVIACSATVTASGRPRRTSESLTASQTSCSFLRGRTKPD